MRPPQIQIKYSSKGFTLIELLVVISVIGLLASVVMIALNSARLKARNTKRLADIRQLTTAFNLGLDSSSSGSLPASGGNNWVCVSASCYGSWATSYPANAGVDAFLAPYIASKPTAPLGSYAGAGGYLYIFGYNGGAVSPYDGSILAGTYLDALMEPPLTPGICGSGRIWDATSNYIECMFKLD